MYQFSNNWFEAHKSSWKNLLESAQPKNILEIGSYEGQSAVFAISTILEIQPQSVNIACIDTWEGGREHVNANMPSVEQRFDSNMKILSDKYGTRFNLRKIKNNSFAALAQLCASPSCQEFDFIYIDGSHDASDVLYDAVASFRLLKVNGLMCFDDFLWHAGDRNPLQTPRQAIEAFISCYRDKVFLFDSGQARQCWLSKTQ
jgi:predicted O-methyltransferase YrrM